MDAHVNIDPCCAPTLTRLERIFEQKHRLARPLIARAAASFGAPWVADFEAILSTLFGTPGALELAAQGYASFAFDTLRRQKAFEASGEYPHKTYAQAAQEVYFNAEHMTREYLPGLLLSHYLWPHHYRQLSFFDTAFLAPMRLAGDPQRFAEVGVGTGVYSGRILRALQQARGIGYDISPSSCAYATTHVHAIGAAGRYEMREQDIVGQPVQPVAWLVCVEVLEHLEKPLEFLRALRAALAPGGRAFITAALNAAHADHIYLYRTAEEVWQQLLQAGFVLEQSFTAAAYAPPVPGLPVPLAAAFVVR